MRATVLSCALAVATLACRKAPPPPVEPTLDPTPGLGPKCVYFKDLRAFLPESLPGFHLARDEGSTGKYGDVQVSEAKRTFAQPEGREVSVRIVDTTMAPDLGRAIKAAVRDAADRAQTDPTAPLVLADAVGFVRLDSAESESSEAKAEATLWVGDRFVVAVTSQGFDGTAEVRGIASKLDLAGLAKLRLDGGRRGP